MKILASGGCGLTKEVYAEMHKFQKSFKPHTDFGNDSHLNVQTYGYDEDEHLRKSLLSPHFGETLLADMYLPDDVDHKVIIH